MSYESVNDVYMPLISNQAKIIRHFCEFPCMSTACRHCGPSQAIKEGDADAKASDRQFDNMI